VATECGVAVSTNIMAALPLQIFWRRCRYKYYGGAAAGWAFILPGIFISGLQTLHVLKIGKVSLPDVQ
jgi:hypothetical protein